VKRLLALAGLAVVLLSACAHTDRPEGVVERWLISLNQGKAGRPNTYAPARVSNEVLPGWQKCDPGSLDVIEVGVHATGTEGHPGVVLVPYRVEYVSDLTKVCGPTAPTAPVRGSAILARKSGRWRIEGVQYRPARGFLGVPSEGGQRIGSASAATWGVAFGISAALMILVALLMRLTPKPMVLPSRKQ
jgi:hypothetical protein